MKKILSGLLFVICISGLASADETTFSMNLINKDGIGKQIGSITVQDSQYGLLIRPDVTGLPPGLHGFHLHQNPDCGTGIQNNEIVPGLAAGGHFDPEKTGRHEGPYAKGHLGDLPALYADTDGNARLPLLAPRLKVSDLKGRSVVIHEGGDNYSDDPKKLGGGGSRIACGIVK